MIRDAPTFAATKKFLRTKTIERYNIGQQRLVLVEVLNDKVVEKNRSWILSVDNLLTGPNVLRLLKMEEISINSAIDNSSIISDDRLTIAQFLAGKNVFITGGTGFLGTLLIERLLSATPDIGKIYVLIRAKNGYSAESRIQRLLSKVVSFW